MTENGNPFMEAREKPGYRTGEKALTEANVSALLEHIKDLEHLGLIELAIAGGIRREDIVRIKTKDLDFANNIVTFYEQKKKRTWKVCIPSKVMNTLSMISKINKGSEFVFPGRSDEKRGQGHISGRTAYNIFNRYLKKAGLEPRPFHALRATCLKMCQKKGWTLEQASKHTGDTIRVIQEHYSRPSDEEMREVAKNKSLF